VLLLYIRVQHVFPKDTQSSDDNYHSYYYSCIIFIYDYFFNALSFNSFCTLLRILFAFGGLIKSSPFIHFQPFLCFYFLLVAFNLSNLLDAGHDFVGDGFGRRRRLLILKLFHRTAMRKVE